MKQKLVILAILSLAVFFAPVHVFSKNETTRKERKSITSGNKKYQQSKWVDAAALYEEALAENPNSAEARYNLGLAEIRQVVNLQDTTARNAAHIKKAKDSFASVAQLAKQKPGLAAKANYNLGNIEFNAKEYQKAIDYYKQTLRIDPNDDRARRNLRIAQLNLKNQQDKNQDKNQDKDKQDKEDKKDQNQQQNQQNQDNQQDKKQNQQQEKQLSPQAANQILQAAENKEAQVRARVNKASKGEKSQSNVQSNRKW